MITLYNDWLKTAWGNPDKAMDKYPKHGIATPHKRLVKALVDNNASPLDLASIIRSVIRFEEVNNPGRFIALSLPSQLTEQIDNALWAKVSVELAKNTKSTSGEFFFTTKNWEPNWLTGGLYDPPDVDLLKGTHICRDEEVSGDPFLRILSLNKYRSGAQREAVRSVLCAPPGETLVINLPTGSGKSLCAFLPAVLPLSSENDNYGVTPIVVPTVSLALDLANAIEPIVGHRVAYRPEEKENSREILIRCKSGLQGPVLVSPESLTGAFSSSLLSASAKGLLNYFVIDEAHMVLSWGDEFRPAFQQIASLRREMLQRCPENPFVTILMSATFTEYHLRWLRSMFSEESRFTIVHAARLRPEPTYWQVKAQTEDIRRKYIAEAICHLPKPLIVYTVKRESATTWYDYIKSCGFNRIGIIHGGTTNNKRNIELEKWNNDQTDIMIATSAFGLGVDKPDIRGVFHVELPETVDRFYQDVGRGGRDGLGSISLLCWRDSDRSIIGDLQNPKFIGPERGFNRWKKMFNKKKAVDKINQVFGLSLDTPAEPDMQGELNERWNIRTLLLLDRAGIINLEMPKKPKKNKINVRILAEGHTDKKIWNERIENFRQELKDDYKKSNRLLETLIEPQTCLSQIFADCYESALFKINVVRTCRGCPVCRENQHPKYQGLLRARRYPKNYFKPHAYSQQFQSVMNSNTVLSVYYPENLKSDDALVDRIKKFIVWFLEHEMVNIVSFHALTTWLEEKVLNNRHWKFFLHDTLPNNSTKYFPTIYVLTHSLPDWWAALWDRIDDMSVPTIILLPQNTIAPDHPGRIVRDIIQGRKLDLNYWEDEYIE